MYNIDKIPLSEKKALVVSACFLYKKFIKSKSIFESNLNKSTELNDVIRNGNDKNFKNISLFEMILNLLTKDQRLIIEKEFLNDVDFSNWYEQYWSKTMYYKIKNEAINNFLLLFYV